MDIVDVLRAVGGWLDEAARKELSCSEIADYIESLRQQLAEETAKVAELERDKCVLIDSNDQVSIELANAHEKIADLTARLEAQEASEPVAWYGESDDGECHLYFDKQDMLREVLRIHTYYPLYRSQQPTKHEASEPVCWITPDGVGWRMRFEPPVNAVPLGWTPLYETPQPTKQEASEPVYMARRKGLNDFFTCDKQRYEALSAKALFETRICYTTPQPSTEKVSQEPDPQLCRFYGVDSFPALVEAMEKHILKLQERVVSAEKPFSFMPQRVREG